MRDLALLQDMMLFVEVARQGSFSRASSAIGVPGATLSRRIAIMERNLGIRLFDRTTRRVELTDAGKRFLDRCGHLVDEARLAHEALRDEKTRPSGHLRVTMPVDLGVSVIGPFIPDFLRLNPGITLDIDLSSRNVDLVADHIDLAIRLGHVQDDKLIAKRLGDIEMALFASPVYLEMQGVPKHPSDLPRHSCIVIRNALATTSWELEGKNGKTMNVLVDGKLKLNNLGLMRLMAERGMGIAPLASSIASEAVAQGRLIQVLSDWRLPSIRIHALTTSRLRSASTNALLDFLSIRLKQK